MPKPARRAAPADAFTRRTAHEWEFVTFRIPPTLNARLEELRSDFGASKGELLRHLIHRAYERFLQRKVK